MNHQTLINKFAFFRHRALEQLSVQTYIDMVLIYYSSAVMMAHCSDTSTALMCGDISQ